MKDYYRILRVPPDASQEQIKKVYWKLALIYAPDTTVLDKDHATAEMQEINEAHTILIDPVKRAEYDRQMEIFLQQSTPNPQISSSCLNFGTLQTGTKKTLYFTVSNQGSIPQEVNFVCSEENGWFSISAVKTYSEENPFPIEVEVTANAEKLPDGNYRGWIEINCDGVIARIDLSLQIQETSPLTSPLSQFSFQQIPKWAIVSTAAIIGILFLGMLMSSFTDTASTPAPTSILPTAVLPTAVLPTATPTPVIPSGQVVFSSIQNGQPVLHLANADGTSEHSLNVSGWSPTWSPDGRQIAFISDRIGGVQQVYLVKAEGGSLTQLTDMPGEKKVFEWAKSGEVMFVCTVNHKSTVYRVDTLGRKAVQVVQEQAGEIKQISWSPNGAKLLFDVFTGNDSRVYSFDLETNQQLQLTDFDSWQPAWSPDGNAIVVASRDGIYSMDRNGKNRLRLTTLPALLPTWSPDNRSIVFLSNKGIPDQPSELWVMNTNGSNLQQLTNSGCWEYLWADENIIYLSGGGDKQPLSFQVWVLNLSVNIRSKITETSQLNVSWKQ